MNGRSESIILQVAFKAAVVEEGIDVKLATAAYYNMLIDLHEELNINPDDGAKKGNWAGAGAARTTPVQGETFIFNGVLVEDFRAAKAALGSTVKPRFPDFKTVNGQAIEGVTTDSGAAWLYGPGGEPNEAINELVAAADTRIL
jgi:hypothetical protein